MASVPLSVVIITYNEEKNILRCIRSVSEIADEIIVLDSHSSDQTRSLAESLGAVVHEREFDGHIEQKNAAIRLANHPHILSLDADEALSQELLESIRLIKNNFILDGYFLNRITSYEGKWLRYGGWYPDRKLRLWDSRLGKWTGNNPHDRFEMVAGSKLGKLKGDLLHYSYASMADHIQQSEKFAEIGARALFATGKKASIIKRFFSPAFRFFHSYFLCLGFLEGKTGFHVARISAWASYQKYHLLHQLHKQQGNA